MILLPRAGIWLLSNGLLVLLFYVIREFYTEDECLFGQEDHRPLPPPPQEPVCLWLGLQLLFSPEGPISEKKSTHYMQFLIFWRGRKKVLKQFDKLFKILGLIIKKKKTV